MRSHPLRLIRTGLTLLELLAAVAILSAVAGAFASVARDASASLRESAAPQRHADARRALALWDAAHASAASELAALAAAADERGAPAERVWRMTVDHAESWVILAVAAPSDAARLGMGAANWAQRAALVTLRVRRDGERPEDALEALRLVPLPTRDAQRAPATGGGGGAGGTP